MRNLWHPQIISTHGPWRIWYLHQDGGRGRYAVTGPLEGTITRRLLCEARAHVLGKLLAARGARRGGTR